MADLRSLLEGMRVGEVPVEMLEEAVLPLGETPTARMLAMDVNRGVLAGTKDPRLAGMPPEALAQLDRFAWGAQGGFGGLPVAIGYEALKAASQTPGLGAVLPSVASGLGFEDTGSQFQQDKTSSPASMGNILAYIQGALSEKATKGAPSTLNTLLRKAGNK